MASEIDFAGIRSNAIAALSPTPDTTPAPDVATSTSVEPNIGEEKVVADKATTSEVRKWKLKDPEGEFEADENELTSGHLRFRDYTRKTQTVAQERRELEAAREALVTREQKINTILSDKDNLREYYEFLTGEKLTAAEAKRVDKGLTPNANADSDEVATLTEAKQLAEAQTNQVREQLEKQMLKQMEETQKWTKEQIAAAHYEAELGRATASNHSDILSTIKAITEEFPLLGDTYDNAELELLLCKDVMDAQPTSLADAKEMLTAAAKERHAKLEKAEERRHQLRVEKKASLTTNGIEPSGGNAPGTPAIKHKLGDKNLTASAVAFMEAASKR